MPSTEPHSPLPRVPYLSLRSFSWLVNPGLSLESQPTLLIVEDMTPLYNKDTFIQPSNLCDSLCSSMLKPRYSHYLLLSAMCFAQSQSPSHLLLSHRPIHLCPFSSPYTHGVLKVPLFLPDLAFKSTFRVPSLPPHCRTVLSVFSLPGDPLHGKTPSVISI